MRHSRCIPGTLAVGLAMWLAVAAEAAEPSIHDAVKASIEQKRINKTDMAGFGIVKTAYRDTGRDGAILVGFEVAVGKSFNSHLIVAIRPFYLTPDGEVAGSPAGSFSSTKDHPVVKTVRLTAKPGYAVGSITLRAGLGIHGMLVTFMPISGTTLDPKGAYRSEWLGDLKEAGTGTTLGGEGAPIMGVFGNVDGKRIIAMGLLFAKPALDATEPTPEPVAASPNGEPPANAAGPSAVAGDSEATDQESRSSTMWLPIGIGVLVVVGTGAMLLFGSRIIASLTKPSPPKSTPNSRRSSNRPASNREPPVVPVRWGDDGIPVVPVCEEDDQSRHQVAVR
jgi:hypothetical protein